MAQTIIVAVIVLAAVAWIVWRAVQTTRGESGCASCDSVGSCPFASKGRCPSQEMGTEKAEGSEGEL